MTASVMDYARFSERGSDVQVIAAEDKTLECCACRLAPSKDGAQKFRSVNDLVAHLCLHISQGHRVPEYTILDLEHDRATLTAWMVS